MTGIDYANGFPVLASGTDVVNPSTSVEISNLSCGERVAGIAQSV